MYQIQVIKKPGVDEDDFEDALRYSVTCIESWLYDSQLQPIVIGDTITIQSVDPLKPMSTKEEAELKCRIGGCFFDQEGQIYPEFSGLNWGKLSP